MPLSQARARATDVEVIDNYFDLLEATLQEYDLLGKPGQIFNLWFSFESKATKRYV